MTTMLEALKAYEWDCPEHPAEGAGNYKPKYGVGALFGAGAARCDNCLIAFVAYLTKAMGVEVPMPPKPEDPLAKYVMHDSTTLPAAMTKKAREIGGLIGSQCPPGVGFMLLLFESGTRNKEYISNGNRQDMIKAMREMADDLEKGDIGEQHP